MRINNVANINNTNAIRIKESSNMTSNGLFFRVSTMYGSLHLVQSYNTGSFKNASKVVSGNGDLALLGNGNDCK